MADRQIKWEENAPGKFYVDETCIAAKYCVSAAPEHFRMSDEGHALVSRQPESEEEEEAVRDALNGCPVNAIGDDGNL